MWKKVAISFLVPLTLAVGLIYSEPLLLSKPAYWSEGFTMSDRNEWPELIYSISIVILIAVSVVAPIVVAWRGVQDEKQRDARKKISLFS